MIVYSFVFGYFCMSPLFHLNLCCLRLLFIMNSTSLLISVCSKSPFLIWHYGLWLWLMTQNVDTNHCVSYIICTCCVWKYPQAVDSLKATIWTTKRPVNGRYTMADSSCQLSISSRRAETQKAMHADTSLLIILMGLDLILPLAMI